MCGIFAVLNNTNTFKGETIQRAIDIGSKRGPETTTTFNTNDNVLLAFHRLAINGLDYASGQPLTLDDITLICNGEIYNYRELFKAINLCPITNSDCEIIIHLYKRFGIEHTLNLLDGVFSFVIYDARTFYSNKLKGIDKIIYIARDPFGVRPLYLMEYNSHEPIIAVASEMKVLNQLVVSDHQSDSFNIKQFQPGTYSSYVKPAHNFTFWETDWRNKQYFNILKNENKVSNIINPITPYTYYEVTDIKLSIYQKLNAAVRKRVIGTSDRPIACLLSGGLDSSLITSLVNKYYNGTLETFSIGMEGSEDLKYARIVAEHLETKHTEITLTNKEFFDIIPEVIKAIESYDTTSVRASVGNYLIGKYISENSDAKVIFNGDGSDELTGGYIYLLKAPNDNEFDNECHRLLKDLYAFDVLRSDKSISSHGLEPRTPFLDKGFVEYYLSIPSSIRNPCSDHPNNVSAKMHNNYRPIEKLLLRQAIEQCDSDLLPKSILWRTKEAFSDGVSGNSGSWFEIIKEKVKELGVNNVDTNINSPTTDEQRYYRNIFDKEYPDCADIVPYFWMPKYVNATDASARSLELYQDLQ